MDSYLSNEMDEMSVFMETYQAGGSPANPPVRKVGEGVGDGDDLFDGTWQADPVSDEGDKGGVIPSKSDLAEPSQEPLAPPRVPTPQPAKVVEASGGKPPANPKVKVERDAVKPGVPKPPPPPTVKMYSVGKLHCTEQSVAFFEKNMYKTLYVWSEAGRGALRGEVKGGPLKGCTVAFLGEPLPPPDESELEVRHVCWLTYGKEGLAPPILAQKDYAGDYARYLPCVLVGGKFEMLPRDMQLELFEVIDVDVMIECRNMISVTDALRMAKVKIPLVPCHVLTKKKENRIRGGGRLDVPAQKKKKDESPVMEEEQLGRASMDDIVGIDYDAADKTVRRLQAKQLQGGFAKLNGLAPNSPLRDYELVDDDMVAFACGVPESADIYGMATQDDMICADNELEYEDVTDQDLALAKGVKAKQRLLEMQKRIEEEKAFLARKAATKKKADADEYRRAGGMNVKAMKQFLSAEKNHDTEMFRGTALAWGKYGYRRLPGNMDMPADFDATLSAWALEKQYPRINKTAGGGEPAFLDTIDNALWEYADERKKTDAATPYDFESEIVFDEEETPKPQKTAPSDQTKHKKTDTMHATKPAAGAGKKSSAPPPAPTKVKYAPAEDDDQTDKALAKAMSMAPVKRAPPPQTVGPPAKKNKHAPVEPEEQDDEDALGASGLTTQEKEMLEWAEEEAAPAKVTKPSKQQQQNADRLAQLRLIVAAADERVAELTPALKQYNENCLASRREFEVVEQKSRRFESMVSALQRSVEERRLKVMEYEKLKKGAEDDLALQRNALRKANGEIHDITTAFAAAPPPPPPARPAAPPAPVAAAAAAPPPKKKIPRAPSPAPAPQPAVDSQPFVVQEVVAYIDALEKSHGKDALKEIEKVRREIDKAAGTRKIEAARAEGDELDAAAEKQLRQDMRLLPDGGFPYTKLATSPYANSFKQVAQFHEFYDPEGNIIPVDPPAVTGSGNLYKLFVNYYNKLYVKSGEDTLARFTRESVASSEKLKRLFENVKVRIASIYFKMKDCEMRAAFNKQNGAGAVKKGKKAKAAVEEDEEEEEEGENWGEDEAAGDGGEEEEEGEVKKPAADAPDDVSGSPPADEGGFFD